MSKRILGLILTVTMIVSMSLAGAAVSAAENDVTITVAAVSGKKGDIVEVPISISENSYLVNADMHILFDNTRLKLADIYYGGVECYAVSDTLFDDTWSIMGNEKTPGDFFLMAATFGNIGITAGGEMFRLAFEILSDDVSSIAITFTADPICGNDNQSAVGDDGYYVDYDIEYTVVNGGVTVEKTALIGDVNFDGEVDIFDAMDVYMYADGSAELSEEALTVADYNQDGSVDIFDAMNLYILASGG